VTDDREPNGRIVHEQRVAYEADRAAAEGRHTFNLGDWGDRTAGQRELDMRIGSAVAAQAVADERRASERMRIQLFALAAHLPAIRRALTKSATDAEYECEAKQYRAAIQALGIGEGEAPAQPEQALPVAAEVAPPEIKGQLPFPGVETAP
jgi:hypothetical protein